jgi:hypothetical protein
MGQSYDFLGTPQLTFEAWRAFLHSTGGHKPEVIEPNAFAGWIRSLSIYGFAAAAFKIRCGFAAMDLGRNAYRSERTHRDVRIAGADWYYAVFQVAGRSAVTQNDQAAQLGVDLAPSHRGVPVGPRAAISHSQRREEQSTQRITPITHLLLPVQSGGLLR